MDERALYGCIEAGGTKFVLGALRSANDVLDTARLPTTAPEATIAAAIEFFARVEAEHGRFAGFGIASFGPVVLDRAAPDWGHVAATPKPGWSGADLVGPFAARFGCAVGFDTDVNGAALAEHRWGAAQGSEVATYITIGTGIGGGLVIDGRPVHGARHPEMGHMRPARHPSDADFAGVCPFHGDCLEGLASGPAILARWGKSLSELPADHVAHDVVAHYLAQLVVAQQALLSPQRIVFGGGVMATPGLIERIRDAADLLAAGYFGHDRASYDRLVAPPGLGDRAGLLGALALAQVV